MDYGSIISRENWTNNRPRKLRRFHSLLEGGGGGGGGGKVKSDHIKRFTAHDKRQIQDFPKGDAWVVAGVDISYLDIL